MQSPTLLPLGTIRPRRRQVRPVRRIEAPAAVAAAPQVEAVLLTATGWHWVVQLRGDIDVVIEYDARRPGVELVKVNSRVVCREGTLRGYNGRFSFPLPGHRPVTQVELEISNSLWSAVTHFSIRLAGETVFVCDTTVETWSLPVPVQTPHADPSQLPLPHPA